MTPLDFLSVAAVWVFVFTVDAIVLEWFNGWLGRRFGA